MKCNSINVQRDNLVNSTIGTTNMKWIGPLFENAGGWKAYVSFNDGAWFIDKDDPIKIERGKAGVMLLPMLDAEYGQGYEYQLSLLMKGLKENNQDPDEANRFPFHVPVVTAFKDMPHWVDYASDWLEYLPLTKEIALEIFDACQNKYLPQASRHKALKAINKWSKEHGFVFVRK